MYIKVMIALVSLGFIVGCGPSVEERMEESYDDGYSEGRQEGVSEALNCVRREGGGADDAADSCEGNI